MDNDFETANAITTIFEFTKAINKLLAANKISEKDGKKIKDLMLSIDKVFGILEEKTEVPKEVKELAEKREQARKNKDFKMSDQLRDEIKSLGYYTDDTKEGYVIKKI